jgi:hypothetical protein
MEIDEYMVFPLAEHVDSELSKALLCYAKRRWEDRYVVISEASKAYEAIT